MGYWNPAMAEQTRRGSNRTVIIIVLVVVAIVVGLFLVGAYLVGSGRTSFGGRTPLADVAVGQCFNGIKASDFNSDAPGVSAGMLFGVTVVDCAEPHESELAGRIFWPADRAATYPGDSEMETFAFDSCSTAFRGYVGIPFDSSVLNMTYIYPQLRSWNEGERAVECLIHPPTGSETEAGSARNSRR